MSIGKKLVSGFKSAAKKYNEYNENIDTRRSEQRKKKTAALKEEYGMLREEAKVRRLENKIERLKPQRNDSLFGSGYLDLGFGSPAPRRSSAPKRKKRKAKKSSKPGKTITIQVR